MGGKEVGVNEVGGGEVIFLYSFDLIFVIPKDFDFNPGFF